MTHNCLICDKIADRKVTTSLNQGELYLCSSKKCKTMLKNRLTENIEKIEDDPMDFQGKSPKQYESSGKAMIWSFTLIVIVVIIYGIYKLSTNY
jgi:uncharacterized membrane protein (DUF106 family)